MSGLITTLVTGSAGAEMRLSAMEVTVQVTNNCTVTTGTTPDGRLASPPSAMSFRAGAAQLSLVCTRGASSTVRLRRVAYDGMTARALGETSYYFYTRQNTSELWGRTGAYDIHARQNGTTGIDAFLRGPQWASDAQRGGPDELVVATLEF